MDQPDFQPWSYPNPPCNQRNGPDGDDPEALRLPLTDWCDDGTQPLSSLGQSPNADLPLNAVNAGCQFSANVQSFQPTLLTWPQPKPTTDLALSSGFEQTLTGAAPATERLGEPYSNPQQKRCVRCWAIQKSVILNIQLHLDC